jgi:hypothetical protein
MEAALLEADMNAMKLSLIMAIIGMKILGIL